MGCAGSSTACSKFEAPPADTNELPVTDAGEAAPSLLRSLATPGRRHAGLGLETPDKSSQRAERQVPHNAWAAPPLQQVAPAALQEAVVEPRGESRRWLRKIRKMRNGRV
eukprot:TRINITY_DN32484_c0_g1_i1.p1 TRINITY_DN32484_c0_g1~~TRINITY_DN32484_c0_g1_i1.p1  ORF type:complete len:119 (+),score=23.61 TRINITY_DN32484_c0_g1_i1:29-358(+)